MTDRAERIERIRELLEDRRHPERRVGIFSATNLTRLVLRFGAMALAAVLVQRILGTGVVGGVVAAVAVGAADAGVARLWKRIGRQVQQAWTTIGIVGACLLVLLAILMSNSPSAKSSVSGFFTRWIAEKNAALDARQRSQRVVIDTVAATHPRWRILHDGGVLRFATYDEAFKACSDIGAGWSLPFELGQWPKLDRYPDFGGRQVSVWGFGHRGIQVGDGKAPAVMSMGNSRPTEVRPVLCMQTGS